MDCHQPFTSFIQMWLTTVGVLSAPFVIQWVVYGLRRPPFGSGLFRRRLRVTEEERAEALQDYCTLKEVIAITSPGTVLSKEELDTAEENARALKAYVESLEVW